MAQKEPRPLAPTLYASLLVTTTCRGNRSDRARTSCSPKSCSYVSHGSSRRFVHVPRLGTNLVDETGVAIVQAWLEAMTEERGYPAPIE